jgi:hypothetical protein
MDFFSAKELVTQTGHEIREWPLVCVKELLDNSLDACEEADISPALEVTADAGGIAVSDNGPGLPESTLAGALNFSIRASNREAYVAPDRGAQGNALKTLLPMSRVIDPSHGKFIVAAHGKRHEITCGHDPVSQRPAITDEVTEVRTHGTTVRLEWLPQTDADSQIVWPFGAGCRPCAVTTFRDRFRELVEGFTVFNPHASITLNWFGHKTTWSATNPDWQKWKPCWPTSSHWYEPPHFERLIGAYITHDRDAGTDRLVSDLVAEFDGLSGSQKRAKVLQDAGLKRARLSEFVVGGRLDSNRIAALLAAMKTHTRPIKAAGLGIIGEDHLRARLVAMGVRPDSFRYRKLGGPKCKNSQSGAPDKASFLPWVLESAFGWLGEESADERRIFTGANWSAAIKNPFRSFGSSGEGLETLLAERKATRQEPIVYVLHLAHPRVEYTDRGKSAIVIGGAA